MLQLENLECHLGHYIQQEYLLDKHFDDCFSFSCSLLLINILSISVDHQLLHNEILKNLLLHCYGSISEPTELKIFDGVKKCVSLNFQTDGCLLSYILLNIKGFLHVKILDFCLTILFIPKVYLELCSYVMSSSPYSAA